MVSEGSVSNLFWAVAPGISSSRMKTQATWILKELQKFKSKPKPTLEPIYGDTLFLGDYVDDPPTHPGKKVTLDAFVQISSQSAGIREPSLNP